MKVYYENIENNEAIHYLRTNNAERDRIAISDADFWVCAKKENGDIIGVIGLLLFGKIARIKCFYVSKIYRNKSIGNTLLQKMILKNKKMTAFATGHSKHLFEKNGFKIKTTNKNGISFMEKEKENV